MAAPLPVANRRMRRLFLQRQAIGPAKPGFDKARLLALIEQLGYVQVDSVNAVDANTVVTDSLAFGCGTGWSRVGMWCIENNLRGGTGSTYGNAITTCHGQGASVCSMGALMACDTIEP